MSRVWNNLKQAIWGQPVLGNRNSSDVDGGRGVRGGGGVRGPVVPGRSAGPCGWRPWKGGR